MLTTNQSKVVLLKKFTQKTVLDYTELHLLRENTLQFETMGSCKKCDTFNNIEVYEWVKEYTFIESFPQDDLGDYLLIFNAYGNIHSCHKI